MRTNEGREAELGFRYRYLRWLWEKCGCRGRTPDSTRTETRSHLAKPAAGAAGVGPDNLSLHELQKQEQQTESVSDHFAQAEWFAQLALAE